MSDVAIRINGASRLFKRFHRPRYRIMDLLGLKVPASGYDEFWALRDVTLDIRRGERVALIGRNGAGKSTLLNLVCGQLQPTRGTVQVNGSIQALMELGTGFHPEFTGRQNVFSALAYQGVTGQAARDLFEEIVDFAELWDFIEQPLKTYSAGMYARLAFSAATAIVPDILIIDEILGAGDAYFASKCAERMYQLTVQTGATVLFVSHDISSVERLCNRAVWIDRGQVTMEGPTLDVSKAYYASIMAQEEARLRAETTKAIARMRRREMAARDVVRHDLLLRFMHEREEIPSAPQFIRSIRFENLADESLTLLTGAPTDTDQNAESQVLDSQTLWGETQVIDGQPVRGLAPQDAPDRHAPFVFRVPEGFAPRGAKILVEHACTAADPIALDFYAGGSYRRLGTLTPTDGGWREDVFTLPREWLGEAGYPVAEPEESETQSRWSSNEAQFRTIEPCVPGSREARFIFGLGEPIAFRIVTDLFVDVPQFWLVVLVFDDKGNRMSMAVEPFPEGLPKGRYELTATFEHPVLRQGEYVVGFEMLAEFDYHWSKGGRFPHLAFWDRSVHFKVNENYSGVVDLGRVEMPMTFSCRALEAAASESGPARPVSSPSPSNAIETPP